MIFWTEGKWIIMGVVVSSIRKGLVQGQNEKVDCCFKLVDKGEWYRIGDALRCREKKRKKGSVANPWHGWDLGNS